MIRKEFGEFACDNDSCGEDVGKMLPSYRFIAPIVNSLRLIRAYNLSRPSGIMRLSFV